MIHPKSHSQEMKDSFRAGEVVQEQSEAGAGRCRRWSRLAAARGDKRGQSLFTEDSALNLIL